MGAIRATDDEQLARELWGDDCAWDEERRQFVPTAAKPARVPTQEEKVVERIRRRTGRKADADAEHEA